MSAVILTSDSLIGTPASGNLEYNGQFFGTDSNASRAQMQRITQGTAVASTSGTSIDFTNLPAWVKRITVMFSGVSTNGTSIPQIQIGSGSIDATTSYSGSAWLANITNTAMSTGFLITATNAATYTYSGIITLTLLGSNIWTMSAVLGHTETASVNFSAGSKTLSGVLDRIRITTVNGTDTFDAGSINILYEG
jgi:hypothetical protein